MSKGTATTARVQGLRNSVVNRKKDKKKGWNGNYRDRLDIPKGAATPILLCPGDYEDGDPEMAEANDGQAPHFHYYHQLFHRYKWKDGKNDGFGLDPCAASWEQYRARAGHKVCLGCHLKKLGDKRVGNAEQYMLNVVQLALHQKVPLEDKNGKVRRYETDGENFKRGDPILSWKVVTAARDRKEVLSNLAEGLEDQTVAMWRKKFVQVGPSHRQQIEMIADLAEQHCRCGGSLTPTSFFCASCEELLCDVEESNMEPEDVLRYALERQRCDACGHWDAPLKQYTCDECDDPRALQFNEVVAYIRKTGEGTDTMITVEKVVPIWQFELPDGTGLIAWDDNDELAMDEEGNYILREDLRPLVENQFDFSKVNTPRDVDYFCKALGVTNPFEQGGGTKRYAKSGTRFEEEEAEEEESPRRPAAVRAGAARRPPTRR